MPARWMRRRGRLDHSGFPPAPEFRCAGPARTDAGDASTHRCPGAGVGLRQRSPRRRHRLPPHAGSAGAEKDPHGHHPIRSSATRCSGPFAAAPPRRHRGRPKRLYRRRTRPEAGGNAPLSIVPDRGATPAPSRPRSGVGAPAESRPRQSAKRRPGTAGGGYAVQVTSQRSEAEAQAEFRALQAKFPSQLGDRQPIIRRADLGAKGVYYRALVGPFASAEAARHVQHLKAAGGSCIVQRN